MQNKFVLSRGWQKLTAIGGGGGAEVVVEEEVMLLNPVLLLDPVATDTAEVTIVEAPPVETVELVPSA
jgi:hypothetical protein